MRALLIKIFRAAEIENFGLRTAIAQTWILLSRCSFQVFDSEYAMQ